MEREREREMQLSALDKHIFTSKAEYTLAQINHLQGTMLNIRNLKVNRIRKGKKKNISEGGFIPTLLTSTALKEATRCNVDCFFSLYSQSAVSL